MSSSWVSCPFAPRICDFGTLSFTYGLVELEVAWQIVTFGSDRTVVVVPDDGTVVDVVVVVSGTVVVVVVVRPVPTVGGVGGSAVVVVVSGTVVDVVDVVVVVSGTVVEVVVVVAAAWQSTMWEMSLPEEWVYDPPADGDVTNWFDCAPLPALITSSVQTFPAAGEPTRYGVGTGSSFTHDPYPAVEK